MTYLIILYIIIWIIFGLFGYLMTRSRFKNLGGYHSSDKQCMREDKIISVIVGLSGLIGFIYVFTKPTQHRQDDVAFCGHIRSMFDSIF